MRIASFGAWWVVLGLLGFSLVAASCRRAPVETTKQTLPATQAQVDAAVSDATKVSLVGNSGLPSAGAESVSRPQSLTERLRPILALSGMPQRREELDDLGAALAAHDPASATAMLKQIFAAKGLESGEAFAFVSGFMAEYARLDPMAAAAWADSLPLALKFDAYAFVAQQWSKADLAGASAWAEQIAEPSLKTAALRRISETVEGLSDPKLHTVWAQRLAASADARQHTETIARLWGKGDLNGAFDWSSQLEDPTRRSSAVVAIASAVAEDDPQAASAWVERFPAGEVRTRAATVTSAKWAESNPAAAARWISQLGDPEILEAGAHAIARRWLQHDRPAATAWIRGAPLADKTREYLLGR